MQFLNILSLLPFLTAVSIMVPTVGAECCPALYTTCNDGTSASPYCGCGKCNFLGCNCDGGCRRSDRECGSRFLAEGPFVPAATKAHRGASDVQYLLLSAETEKKQKTKEDNAVEEFFAKYKADNCEDLKENIAEACLGKLIMELVSVKVW